VIVGCRVRRNYGESSSEPAQWIVSLEVLFPVLRSVDV
jgi:hypothetical protein